MSAPNSASSVPARTFPSVAGRAGAGANRCRVANPAWSIPDNGLPCPGGCVDSSHAAGSLAIFPRGPRSRAGQLDLGIVPGAPSREWTVDISCVTKWTKLDMRWRGISVDTLFEHIDLESQCRLRDRLVGWRIHGQLAAVGHPQRPGLRRLQLGSQPLRSRRMKTRELTTRPCSASCSRIVSIPGVHSAGSRSRKPFLR